MKVRFAHISDLHFKKDYRHSSMTSDFAATGSPTEKLERALELMAGLGRLDFVLITGDLVHEGEAADYEALRGLLEGRLPGRPLVAVPGNHDHRPAFCQGFWGKPYKGRPLDYIAEHGGLKLVVLDGGTAKIEGQISAPQLAWLKESLAVPGAAGTALAIHQPFATGIPMLDTRVPEGFTEAIQYRLDAIFCGHTHMPNLRHFAGIPQLTAGGIGFGAGLAGRKMLMTSQASFNYCTLEAGKLDITWMPVWPRAAVAEVLDLGL